MDFECPHCHTFISYFNWKEEVSGYRRGTATITSWNNTPATDISEMDFETTDEETEPTSETQYECPECEEIISLDRIQAFLQEEKKLTAKTTSQQISDTTRIIVKNTHTDTNIYLPSMLGNILSLCPLCNKQYISKDESDECPHCQI